ncbi:MAG: CPBP family intramembrane glutamic endopeptidase [Micropruina sp.]
MPQVGKQSWVSRLATEPPPPGVDYSEILDSPERRVAKSIGGILIGVLAFFVTANIVTQSLIALFWVLGGQQGDLATASKAAVRFETPQGMLAVHLGLATLIPISMAMLIYIHRRHPAWLVSVRPWFRWRFLLASMLIATVVLSLLLAVKGLGQSVVVRPQDQFLTFLLVILLTSPLQAAAEEFFFRGYLLQASNNLVRSPWFGVVTSAAIFALFHGSQQNLPLFLDRFAFGVLAGVLVVRTGGLEAAIGAHVVNNVLAFVSAGLVTSIAEVKAIQQVGWSEAAWDLAGFTVFTLAALWLGRRMNVATHTPGQRRAEDLDPWAAS